MDRDSFCLIVHDMAITARIAGLRDLAAELRGLEADAAQNFGRLFWSPKRATTAFMAALGVWQDSLADALESH